MADRGGAAPRRQDGLKTMVTPPAAVVAHPAGRRFPGASDEARPLVRRAVGFARLLRDNGFPVGLAEVRDALAFLHATDLAGTATGCGGACGRS